MAFNAYPFVRRQTSPFGTPYDDPFAESDRADLRQAVDAGRQAISAPYGSLAYEQNPFRYGSIESQRFPGMFGTEAQRGFDDVRQSLFDPQGFRRRQQQGAPDYSSFLSFLR